MEISLDKGLIFLLILLMIGTMAIGFFVGQFSADNTWQAYHMDYKEKIKEYCMIDPENASTIPFNYVPQATFVP